MNISFVIYALGKLLIIVSGIMCLPAALAFFEIHPAGFPDVFFHQNILGFLIAIISSWLIGFLMARMGKGRSTGDNIREGFAVVTFGWISVAFFGSLPLFVYFVFELPAFDITSVFGCFTDAYFENMSGFTTTGATILNNIEALPKGLLFWRSMTHWLGGMGIMTLALAIFPAFGVAAYQIFRGEIPGPTAERMRPQLKQTVTILWGVYALLTALETALLALGGMSAFDAVCHAFGTMATGGFSTKNASVGHWNSPFIEWVVIVFMFLAGVNFLLHYSLLFKLDLSGFRQNGEFRFYLSVMLVAVLISVVVLSVKGVQGKEAIQADFRNEALSGECARVVEESENARISGVHDRVRHAVFQVVSLTTTTGYTTADFDVWPGVLRMMFVILMFFGGCAGSTGGGIKMVRIMVFLKVGWREVKTMIQPRLISPLKISGKAMDEKIVANILGFIALFMILFVFFSGVMCLIIPDLTTAVTSVTATMCNIGPGLSGVGATQNYAWIPGHGKWVLILCMLLGRLEIYTVLIVLAPLSWRK